ncbi:hypothetical protein ACXZ7F_11415 [Vibrio harveyi]
MRFVFIAILFTVFISGNLYLQLLTSEFAQVLFCAFVTSFLIDWCIKRTSIRKIPIEYRSRMNVDDICICIVRSVVSSGYALADLYKNTIKSTKKESDCGEVCSCKARFKGCFIRESNKWNLKFSCLVIIVLTIAESSSLDFTGNQAFKVLIYALILRVLSRSLEIIYAFTMDVIKGRKNNSSDLDKYDRIKLAINSYFESILNFTAVYYVMNGGNVADSLFKSFATGTISNVTIVGTNDQLLSFFTTLQVVTSLSLVVLSLAIYVGREK